MAGINKLAIPPIIGNPFDYFQLVEHRCPLGLNKCAFNGKFLHSAVQLINKQRTGFLETVFVGFMHMGEQLKKKPYFVHALTCGASFFRRLVINYSFKKMVSNELLLCRILVALPDIPDKLEKSANPIH
ncbi:MAG: hypothetical protein WC263_04425 [Candidatus Micrarchaeia archaeon]